jgi:hypothetical protein
MKFNQYLAVLAFSALFVYTTTQAGQQPSGLNRKISSIRSNDNARITGQGPSMLKNVTQTQPGFLKQASYSNEHVQLHGFCRDNYGFTYPSGSKQYGDCIDDRSRLTGPSVNNYFGPGQRAAGLGIVLAE